MRRTSSARSRRGSRDLVRHGSSEQSHDSVAHHLIDGALVAMDGLHHLLEYRIEDLPRLLGIAVGEQLHGALEVGEEDRDLLAFAFEGLLRREDLLCEVLRRVGGRRGEGGARRSREESVPALVTELCSSREIVPTGRARGREESAALEAELRARRVLLPALRAPHDPGPARFITRLRFLSEQTPAATVAPA